MQDHQRQKHGKAGDTDQGTPRCGEGEADLSPAGETFDAPEVVVQRDSFSSQRFGAKCGMFRCHLSEGSRSSIGRGLTVLMSPKRMIVHSVSEDAVELSRLALVLYRDRPGSERTVLAF